MEKITLGNSDLQISKICLGTMTFGEQNTEADAHDQLDYAVERGVNFIDTAEMYPVMPRGETQGRTEQYIGSWLKKSGKRSSIILATKAAGPSRGMSWIRNGESDFDAVNLRAAIDTSLQRLQTDYIDLYQLHWPSRNVPIFGQTSFDPQKERPSIAIEETLVALADLIKAGKIRHVGVSNETPWGVCEFIKQAETNGLPRIVSIQNACNLVNRSVETGLDEVPMREIAFCMSLVGTMRASIVHYGDGGHRIPGNQFTYGSHFPLQCAACVRPRRAAGSCRVFDRIRRARRSDWTQRHRQVLAPENYFESFQA